MRISSSRVEDVKRGVLQAGGFPVELPAISLSEIMVKPTTMLYRNFLAMETEELIRSHPIDGVVLMGGCDKTTPGLILGATSAGVPAIFTPAGPMLRGNWHGKVLGSGSDAIKYWDERRAGNISAKDWSEMEVGIARSYGVCMTMGTASTMTALADVIGMSLPGASSIPAADSNHIRMCADAGRRIVEMVWEDLTPAEDPDRGRLSQRDRGCDGDGLLDQRRHPYRRDGAARGTQHLARRFRRGEPQDARDRQHPPERRQISDGGFLLRRRAARPADAAEAVPRSLARSTLPARPGPRASKARASTTTTSSARSTIRSTPRARSRCCRGNLAPNGCVMKPSAAAPHLLKHSGPALVFDNYAALKAAIDRDDLEVTPEHVLVLRNSGPLGAPGMPEWGMLPIPKKLVRQGVRDMVRISDARMSGTAYGACILHVSPESYVGGALALVRTGDVITLDVAARRLTLDVPEAELAQRRATLAPADAALRARLRLDVLAPRDPGRPRLRF